ncbi:hypothetical protein IFM89_006301 [Coptis chinensis]|uniref:Uncharacterized protein n=1 Tax=Coptis chinensis TaxID=261450 RepID=A0A835GW89_9MAGN|nr:hypothetical protein IFM89_006301 [Coptis chinensis]
MHATAETKNFCNIIGIEMEFRIRIDRLCSWIPPIAGSFKLNADGAMNGAGNAMVKRGNIIDSEGDVAQLVLERSKSLPAKWRGLRDGELSKESSIPGCIFVNMNRFIGGNATYDDGALAMARASLKN